MVLLSAELESNFARRAELLELQVTAVLGFQILDAKVLGPRIQVVGFFFPPFEINGGIDQVF